MSLEEYDAFILMDWNQDRAFGDGCGVHTMSITVDKKIDDNGDYSYSITRNNDNDFTGFTTKSGKEGLYELLMEYTIEKDSFGYQNVDDGAIKIIGVKNDN